MLETGIFIAGFIIGVVTLGVFLLILFWYNLPNKRRSRTLNMLKKSKVWYWHARNYNSEGTGTISTRQNFYIGYHVDDKKLAKLLSSFASEPKASDSAFRKKALRYLAGDETLHLSEWKVWAEVAQIIGKTIVLYSTDGWSRTEGKLVYTFSPSGESFKN